MNRIKVEIDDKGTEYTVPDRFDELTREQLLAVCAAVGGTLSESSLLHEMSNRAKNVMVMNSDGFKFISQRVFDRSQ